MSEEIYKLAEKIVILLRDYSSMDFNEDERAEHMEDIEDVAKLLIPLSINLDTRIVDFMEKQRDYYSKRPMRAVTGYQWGLIDERGNQTFRAAAMHAMEDAKP